MPPDVARVVCDENGTTAATPQVRPQADGVHVLVANRLGEDASFSWEGGGRDAPPGATEIVMDEPPGAALVGCRTIDQDGGDTTGFTTLHVVDPDGIYRTGMECAEVPPGGNQTADFQHEVEVDRDGHAIAFARYEDDGHGGWLLAGIDACPGVDLGP